MDKDTSAQQNNRPKNSQNNVPFIKGISRPFVNAYIELVTPPQYETSPLGTSPVAMSPSTSNKMVNIVPWTFMTEWHRMCGLLRAGRWSEAIRKLQVWQSRVASLPLWAEATLFLLQAKVMDELNLECNLDATRSLYSLALVRLLISAGQMAATTMGETTWMPTKELTASLGMPDWIVTLRNEVTHGVKVPTLDVLRTAGEFMMSWLKTDVWTASNIIPADEPEEKEMSDKNIMSAFVAARLYYLRGTSNIDDPQILDCLNMRRNTTSFNAVSQLKDKLVLRMRQNWTDVYPVFVDTLIPSLEFCADLKSTCDDDLFLQLDNIWKPITKVILQSKGVCNVLLKLGSSHIGADEHVQELGAKWIESLMDGLEINGKLYTNAYEELLKIIVSNPNKFSKLVFPKLIKVLSQKMEPSHVESLTLLNNIWMEQCCPFKMPSADEDPSANDLFTVECARRQSTSSSDPPSDATEDESSFSMDQRLPTWWKGIPFGTDVPK